MSKKILVPLATGFEEIEAVSIIDVCRRAKIEVVVCAFDDLLVLGANNMTIKADYLIEEIKDDTFDMIVLPGGIGGTEILSSNDTIQDMLKQQYNNDKLVGAICAAPFALHKAGVLNQNYTCYPSCEVGIREDGYTTSQNVVKDQNVLTSRGPGTAICFALEIVKELEGEESYIGLKSGLLANFC
jgi:4-methyl-5(b-hydroxyethyl)-thiazole monophosphate biosynthesis